MGSFGGEGLRNLLKGVDICCKEGDNSKRIFDWKGNGRFYRLESHKNDAENNLLCLVTDGEGKRHKIFILEGQGLIKGWDMLVAKLTKLGIKGKTEGCCWKQGVVGYSAKGMFLLNPNFPPLLFF